MHKFRVLLSVSTGEMALGDASKLLECDEKTVKQLVTLWESRLKYVVPVIDKLLEPVNTKGDQAKLKLALAGYAKTSTRQVNRLLKSSNIEIPKPIKSVERIKKRENAQNRVKMREKYALDVIAGLTNAEYAAEAAEVTKRHMYRLVNDMVKTEGYVFRDLDKMSDSVRKAFADRLEAKWKES